MSKSKNIFFWSPFLSNVGTKLAVTNSIEILKDKTNNKIFLINLMGEFEDFSYKGVKKITFLNIKNILPQNGLLSKISIWTISIISIPWLIINLKKNNADIIISNLISIIPLFANKFLKIKIICSIQGYPKFTSFRKFLWKLFYKKSNLIISMSNITKNEISKKIGIKKNIIKIDNPIMDKKVIKLSKKKIDKKERKIFKKNTFICIGRLTRQKNFKIALKAFINFNKIMNFRYNLVILGEGEEEKELKSIASNHKQNIFFLGYKKNPYNYIKSSKLLISTSLWEDPGHALIEAAYLKVPIMTSNCPAGPREIFNSNNCIKYNNQKRDLEKKLVKFSKFKKNKIENLKINAFQLSKNFSKDEFFKKISKFL